MLICPICKKQMGSLEKLVVHMKEIENLEDDYLITRLSNIGFKKESIEEILNKDWDERALAW